MKEKKLSIAVVVIVLALSSVAYWFVQRMAVGTWRHALNHQEFDKDHFRKATRELCKSVNAGRIWIGSSDPRYKNDIRASSSQVYQYIALEHIVLKNSACLTAFLEAAINVNHSSSLVFIDDNGIVIADFYFFKGSE
jgi:hypothetical protein